jgi:leader peptidase (prepilin peptidase)/N-methyltransferase
VDPAPVFAPTPFVLVLALFGLLIGSFLNVVIYRVPRGESLISPGSHCPSCETPLKSRHNIPVLSWLALRGRCAYCASPISIRYPLVEAGTALLFMGIAVRFGMEPQVPAYLYLAAVAETLVLIQFDVRALPDAIVVPSYVISGLLLIPAGAAAGDWWAGERAAIGMLALITLFFLLTLAFPHTVGFAEMRLAGLLGLYLGWMSWIALAVSVVATITLVPLIGKLAEIAADFRSRMNTLATDGGYALPVAPCLISAALLALFVVAPTGNPFGLFTG